MREQRYAHDVHVTGRIALTSVKKRAGMPRPVAAPPTPQLDDVTYGYVPKSMSSMRALAPSTMTFLPDDRAGNVRVSAGSAEGSGRGQE